jgi:hypothetical protein
MRSESEAAPVAAASLKGLVQVFMRGERPFARIVAAPILLLPFFPSNGTMGPGE